MDDNSINTVPERADSAGYRMRILSALAISFVVLGHMNFTGDMTAAPKGPLTFGEWFPYYSFHLALFLFISGYFFTDLPEGRKFMPGLLRFAGKKARKLLLPCYIYTGLSLLLNGWLHTQGFTFGFSFTLSRWLLNPWTAPYTVTFSVADWYLPALFLAEIYFALLRAVFRRLIRRSLQRETALLAFTLAAGIGAVYWKETAALSGAAVVYLRSVVMLFFLQAGALYRRHLEARDTMKNSCYFPIVFIAQFLLILLCGSGSLTPGLFGLRNMGKSGAVFFAGGITGILLWLRVSAILASLPRRSRLVVFIGRNTKHIMAAHIFCWFLLNTLLNRLHALNPGSGLASGFSGVLYRTFMYYCSVGNPRMILLYYLAGMGLPLLGCFAVQSVRRRFTSRAGSLPDRTR